MEASLKVGKQGLGFVKKALSSKKHTYQSVKTKIYITPKWLPFNIECSPCESDVKLWMGTRINVEPRVHRVGER